MNTERFVPSDTAVEAALQVYITSNEGVSARQIAKTIRNANPAWTLGAKRVQSTIKKMVEQKENEVIEKELGVYKFVVNLPGFDSPVSKKNMLPTRLRKRVLQSLPIKANRRTPGKCASIPNAEEEEYKPTKEELDEAFEGDDDAWEDVVDEEFKRLAAVTTPNKIKKKKKKMRAVSNKRKKMKKKMNVASTVEPEVEYTLPTSISIDTIAIKEVEVAETSFVVEYDYDDIVTEVALDAAFFDL
jgi:hypothetical protein